MNIEHIRKVIDAIRTGDGHPKIGFNMMHYTPTNYPDRSGRGCGTAMCIGGWAYALAKRRISQGGTFATARDYLGLDDRQASELFYAQTSPVYLAEITANHAIAVLEHLIETGEVDWTIHL